MKKLLLILFIFPFVLSLSGQKRIDKIMDKYNVQSAKVSGYTFMVGDTLTFASGSLPNGDFVCTQMAPEFYMQNLQTPPHIPASNTNYKYIISKIRVIKDNLNVSTMLVINLKKDVNFWIDVDLAIIKKEIILK